MFSAADRFCRRIGSSLQIGRQCVDAMAEIGLKSGPDTIVWAR
jgi:hypothetical protein